MGSVKNPAVSIRDLVDPRLWMLVDPVIVVVVAGRSSNCCGCWWIPRLWLLLVDPGEGGSDVTGGAGEGNAAARSET